MVWRKPIDKNGRYDIQKDATFSKSARNKIESSSFNSRYRIPSEKTIYGYSSGYHEAILTNRNYNILRNATPKDKVYTLSDEKKVYSKMVEIILKQGPSYRTDTSQTILSRRKGNAAGHTGSGVKLAGQAEAHNLINEHIIDIMGINPDKSPGLTEKSIAVLLGAMSVTSMAPGEVARSIKGGTSSLKAGEEAKKNWEINRTESKRRVESMFQKLNPTEKEFVSGQQNKFIKKFNSQDNTRGRQKTRSIIRGRATSVERDSIGVNVPNSEVRGGIYMEGSSSKAKSPLFPYQKESLSEIGAYFTQPFRAVRGTVDLT